MVPNAMAQEDVMKRRRVKLNLNGALGQLLATKLSQPSLTPEQFRRNSIAAFRFVETQSWIVPTKSEIVTSSDDLVHHDLVHQ
jgi:hypothetical protein